ncbi:MAG: spermidine/putrescine ABC transporter ATP-binding protein PotA [Desulfocapsaceae bacterium]|nr:spermidine/putrescine ABC transporter ATP-binding protein PotA [Desulfocapsaceae bacterium]
MATDTHSVLSLQGLSKSFDDIIAVDHFSLEIVESEFITLLGPSGCGKTTLLRLIAGFEQPDHGSIYLDGKNIGSLPPEKRQVNTVFQSYALFPHMTVYENIAFGLRLKRVEAGELKKTVEAALEQTKMTPFAGRMPSQLSGGQQQRVAMARAIVNKPRVLLLDEPLSALDARLRSEMQVELKRLQRELNITTILVTHEQDEALSLSDRVVVMSEGEIAQIGTPREIYEEPRSLYVARFIGDINLLPAEIDRRIDDTSLQVTLMGTVVILDSQLAGLPGTKVQILLRPEDLRLGEDIKEGMVRFGGTILERRYQGATLDTTIQLDGGPTVQACEFFDEDDPDFDYRIGERVEVSWVYGWEVVLHDDE